MMRQLTAPDRSRRPGTNRGKLSLRGRILVLVALALVPSLLLTYVVGQAYRQVLREQVQADALRLARFAAAAHGRNIETAQQLLLTLAQLPEIRGGDPAACSQLLGRILTQHALYTNLGVADLQGDIYCSALPPSGPVNIADRLYFQRALEHGTIAIGRYQIGRITGRPGLNVGFPVRDSNGEIVSVVFTAIGLEYLNSVPPELDLPEGATVTVFDHSGTVLVRYPDPENWVGKSFPDDLLVSTILALTDGVTETAGIDGVDRLYGFSVLPGPPESDSVHVAVGLPAQTLYAAADALLARNLIGLTLINLLIVVILLLASERLVLRGTRSLVQATRRLAAGELSARTGAVVGGEIGELAVAFDHMAASLEKQQRELRQAEARYRTLIEHLPSAIYSLDVNGGPRVKYVSPQIEDLTGRTPQEWAADPNSWRKQIHPEDAPTVLYYQLHAAASGEPFRAEYRILNRSGQMLWVRDQARLLQEPETGEQYVLGVLTDISQRKAAEVGLEESERRYRTLVEQLPSIVYVYDHRQARRVTYISPQLEALLGHSPSDWLEGAGVWEDLVHPHDRSRVLEALHRAREQGGAVDLEYRLQARDGRFFWFHDISRPVVGVDGRPEYSLGLLNDVTPLREAEQAERRQREIADALRDTAETLAGTLDLDEVLDRMLAGLTRVVPHEAATIMLIEGAAARVVRARGYAELGLAAPAMELSLPVDQTYNLRVMRDEGRPILIPDVERDPQWVRTTSGSWLRSYLGVPIRSRGQVIGFLNIESSEPGSFQMEVAETLRAFADQAGQAIDNARLFEDAHRRLAQLQGLRTIDAAISGSVDLRLSLRVLLEQVIRQLGVDAADVLVLDARSQRLRYTAGQGFRGAGSPDADLSLGEGPAGLAALERRTVRVPDLAMLSGEFPRKSQLVAEGFASLFAVPLLAKGQVRGVLEVFHRSRLAGDSEWIAFLETLAGEAAIAVDNAALFEDLQRSNLELMVAFDATLESWSRALDLRNHEPEGNSLRVADLAVRAAAHMGVPEDTLPHIRRGALLHDIGMLALPESVLLKPGPLSESEWEAVRAHPQRALDLLAHVEFLRPALEIPYGHHERFDGSGYPRRLAGEAIPAGARAFAVVDVWDALSSDRPYRPAWSDARVSAHLRENAGRLFDSRAVAAFFEALAES